MREKLLRNYVTLIFFLKIDLQVTVSKLIIITRVTEVRESGKGLQIKISVEPEISPVSTPVYCSGVDGSPSLPMDSTCGSKSYFAVVPAI